MLFVPSQTHSKMRGHRVHPVEILIDFEGERWQDVFEWLVSRNVRVTRSSHSNVIQKSRLRAALLLFGLVVVPLGYHGEEAGGPGL
jgi:hypothetical protein